MIWPNLCVDNFFQEPDKVVEFANSLTFTKPKIANYPGKRSEALYLINNEFFEFCGLKNEVFVFIEKKVNMEKISHFGFFSCSTIFPALK